MPQNMQQCMLRLLQSPGSSLGWLSTLLGSIRDLVQPVELVARHGGFAAVLLLLAQPTQEVLQRDALRYQLDRALQGGKVGGIGAGLANCCVGACWPANTAT